MKELKAIEILKHNKNAMIKFINSFDDDCKEDDEYISGNKYIEELDEAIKELEELNNISCLNCKKYKGNIKKDCKTLTYEFNQQLKINGYLMNESEFYCSRHEAKGE